MGGNTSEGTFLWDEAKSEKQESRLSSFQSGRASEAGTVIQLCDYCGQTGVIPLYSTESLLVNFFKVKKSIQLFKFDKFDITKSVILYCSLREGYN